LRAAYPDRIEFSIGGSPEEYAAKVDSGQLDMAVDVKTVAPEEQIRRYEADPELASRVFATPNDAIHFVTMNVAAPPFDDLHVRKAVSLAIDKQGLRELAGGAEAGTIATHIAPDSLADNVLLDYDPYPSPGARGDSEAAKAEMAQSPYDANGDGVCDARACERVRAFTRTDRPSSLDEAKLIARSLRAIGIELSVRSVDDPNAFYATVFDPSARVPLALGMGWTKDFPNGSSYFSDLFASANIGNGGNPFLVGATTEQLAGWEYATTSAPSVDDKLGECSVLVGGAQVHCWAELDQLLMEEVVPLVPWLSETTVRLVSSRVASYTIDQFVTIPAFDRIALAEVTR
jgi:peptide/nickel transport system substrate-binding protein